MSRMADTMTAAMTTTARIGKFCASVILMAVGDRDLSIASWEVEGPTDTYTLDLKGTFR